MGHKNKHSCLKYVFPFSSFNIKKFSLSFIYPKMVTVFTGDITNCRKRCYYYFLYFIKQLSCNTIHVDSFLSKSLKTFFALLPLFS